MRKISFIISFRINHPRCSVKKDVLKNFVIFPGKHLCWSLLLTKLLALKPATLLKSDFNTGVFCEYCKFFKNIHFEEHLRAVVFHVTIIKKPLNSSASHWVQVREQSLLKLSRVENMAAMIDNYFKKPYFPYKIFLWSLDTSISVLNFLFKLTVISSIKIRKHYWF